MLKFAQLYLQRGVRYTCTGVTDIVWVSSTLHQSSLSRVPKMISHGIRTICWLHGHNYAGLNTKASCKERDAKRLVTFGLRAAFHFRASARANGTSVHDSDGRGDRVVGATAALTWRGGRRRWPLTQPTNMSVQTSNSRDNLGGKHAWSLFTARPPTAEETGGHVNIVNGSDSSLVIGPGSLSCCTKSMDRLYLEEKNGVTAKSTWRWSVRSDNIDTRILFSIHGCIVNRSRSILHRRTTFFGTQRQYWYRGLPLYSPPDHSQPCSVTTFSVGQGRRELARASPSKFSIVLQHTTDQYATSRHLSNDCTVPLYFQQCCKDSTENNTGTIDDSLCSGR